MAKELIEEKLKKIVVNMEGDDIYGARGYRVDTRALNIAWQLYHEMEYSPSFHSHWACVGIEHEADGGITWAFDDRKGEPPQCFVYDSAHFKMKFRVYLISVHA